MEVTRRSKPALPTQRTNNFLSKRVVFVVHITSPSNPDSQSFFRTIHFSTVRVQFFHCARIAGLEGDIQVMIFLKLCVREREIFDPTCQSSWTRHCENNRHPSGCWRPTLWCFPIRNQRANKQTKKKKKIRHW